ncbi:hypothetical protein ACJRO7_035712 [Eucalyptus globulus]|uniref:Uncharacterized protein n=1 Tax=Eucalyptus globulus TaxID=34317 RepID=A0ABD3JCR0_EUCGL
MRGFGMLQDREPRDSIEADVREGVVRSLLDLPSEIKRRNADVIIGSGTQRDQPSTIESYAQAMHKLVANIAAKLARTAGLSGEPFKEWICHFRMNKLLTILQDDDNRSGLDVMDSSGSFMALIWSNGRWRNLKHRVLCKEAAAREGVVEAPPPLVNPNHLHLYGPVVYEEFRNLRIS